MHQDMLELARNNRDVDFLLRPHPYMFGSLVGQNRMSLEALADWRKNWDALPNTATDETSSYAALMLAADLLFTDGISFIAEYPLVTRRPAVFWEKPGHWSFNPMGEIAAKATIKVGNLKEFETQMRQAMEWGLPSRSEEIDDLFAAASPFPGEAAKRILAIVQADARDLP
jgi:hypothetical protein